MAIEHKEIVDAIEESTKTLKRNFETQRELDQKSFDQKIEKVISDLKETDLKDFQTKAQIEEFVKLKEAGLQKNFDEFAAKSFRKGLHDALAENHQELKSLSGSDSKIIQLKDMGFEDFNGYDIFTRDVQSRVIPTKEEAFHMRQILGSGATSGDTVYYPKATGKTGSGPDAWDYDKAVVANTVAKSDFEMTFDNVTAPVKWIAGILRIPKQMLDDLAWMQS